LREVVLIYHSQPVRSVECGFNDAHLTEEILLNESRLLVDEDIVVDLNEVLKQLLVGQVAVRSEELEVEVSLGHLVGLYDGALVDILDARAACFIVLVLGIFNHEFL
jgi:hypothetical protein